jgi:hypothetical protein
VVVGVTSTAAGVAVAIIVTTTAVAGVAAEALATAAAPVAPLHQLPAKAGAAPPGRPSTTPRLAPSTCGWACPGHRSRLDRRTFLHCTAGGATVHTSPPLAHLPLPRAPPPQQQPWTPWSGEWDPQSLAGSFSTMELTPPTPATDWVADSSTSNHTTPSSCGISSPRRPSAFHLHSTIVGNGSTLPVTSVGEAVLLGPFYLNDVLVASDLVQSLLSVHRFTTENSCSMEFNPFGLSVKNLATWSVIARYNSSGPRTPSRFMRRPPSQQMLHRTPWQPWLRPPLGTAILVFPAPTSSPSCRATQ